MSRKLRQSTFQTQPPKGTLPPLFFSESARFAQALQCEQQGNLAGAEAAYREVLARNPRHAESLHYLGTIRYRQGRLDEAAEWMAQSIVVDGNQASFYSNLGLVLQAQGLLDQAEAVHRQALHLQPNYPEASNNLGTALQAQGRLDEALQHYTRALALKPDYGQAHSNAGTVLKERGQLEQAIRHYRTAVLLDPRSSDARFNLGNAFHAQEKLEEAIEQYKAALAIRPNAPEVYVNWGNVLMEQSKALGKVAAGTKRREAILKFREVVRLDPRRTRAVYNLAHALQLEGELEEAIALYQRALEDDPHHAEAYVNWGNALDSQGKVLEAIPLYERGCALFDEQAGPDLNAEAVTAHMNLGMARFVTGKFAEGFAHYEWRYKVKGSKAYNEFPQPQWQGEPLRGKRILLRWEQGLGDSLQFLRYVPLVQEAGGEVVVQVQPCLLRLVAAMPGVTALGADDPLPSFDTHCSLMSLAKVFGTIVETIPATVPYLQVPEEERRAAAGRRWPEHRFKVGLVWTGSACHMKDHLRSLTLSQVEPLLALEGIHFYSLQLQADADLQADAAIDPRLIDLELVAENMADTAAKILHLDLVIAVDTAVAHLSGALGVPTWVMVPFAPDWRWLLEREDSPWYPTMRLFRQPRLGDWASVVQAVRTKLAEAVELRAEHVAAR